MQNATGPVHSSSLLPFPSPYLRTKWLAPLGAATLESALRNEFLVGQHPVTVCWAALLVIHIPRHREGVGLRIKEVGGLITKLGTHLCAYFR